MADGAGRQRWNHTSAILWMLATIHHDPKKRRPKMDDFNPYAESVPRRTATVADLADLRTTLENTI